ncbi:MAG: hypothetical protein EPGJADBJ_00086 [Saprospiraceae bacterium]|nr:hypothetical protein [Saprospiraceae bacterium]
MSVAPLSASPLWQKLHKIGKIAQFICPNVPTSPYWEQKRSMRERIKRHLPIGYLNYYRYFKSLVANYPFSSGALPGIFDEIYRTHYWKGRDSVCGPTSGAAETIALRIALQQLWRDLSVRSVLDIPCGDFAWMKEMDLSGIAYTGADIVPAMVGENNRLYAAPNIRFECLDLTRSILPSADLVICRDCLLHLSFEHIHQAVTRIKHSGSTWLLCTSFVQNKFNYDIRDGLWRTLNMQKSPFRFPPPERIIPDNQLLESGVYRDKALCLWRVSDI